MSEMVMRRKGMLSTKVKRENYVGIVSLYTMCQPRNLV